MANTASICSTFDVTVLLDPPFGNGSTGITVPNVGPRGNTPGRPFRVQQVLVTASGGAGLSVRVRQNDAAGASVALLANPGGAVVDEPAIVAEANTVFAEDDDLYLDLAAGLNDTVSKVIVRCLGNPAQSLTLS